MFALYVAGYSGFRIFEETQRIDYSNHFLGLRVNFFVALVLCLLGLAWFVAIQRGWLGLGGPPRTRRRRAAGRRPPATARRPEARAAAAAPRGGPGAARAASPLAQRSRAGAAPRPRSRARVGDRVGPSHARRAVATP